MKQYVLVCLRGDIAGIDQLSGSLSPVDCSVVDSVVFDDKDDAIEAFKACRSRILAEYLWGDTDTYVVQGYMLEQHDIDDTDKTDLVSIVAETVFDFAIIAEDDSVVGTYPTYTDAYDAYREMYIDAQAAIHRAIVAGDDDARRQAIAKRPIGVRLPF